MVVVPTKAAPIPAIDEAIHPVDVMFGRKAGSEVDADTVEELVEATEFMAGSTLAANCP